MKLLILFIFSFPTLIYSKTYRVGENWDRREISKASEDLQFLKESVGEVGARATLFYIGQKNGKHLAITNFHVCPALNTSLTKSINRCINQRVSFFNFRNHRGRPLRGRIISVPFTEKSLDLSVVVIDFENLFEFDRSPTPLKLSNQMPYQFQKLISVGYGIYNNEFGLLTIEENSFDCQVFSQQIKQVKDPDTLNPVPYRVKSFLHGCDVSHGDSGSPILDRASLEVVGLLWTGKYPKHNLVSQAGFENLPLEFLWKELNYASPAYLILDILESIEF